MAHFSFIEINHFKSIEYLQFPTSRVNLFIGKPNVGKSNILEALGMFTVPYLTFNRAKKISDLIRCNKFLELFPFSNISKPISIKSDWLIAELKADREKFNLRFNISEVVSSNRLDLKFTAIAEEKSKAIFDSFQDDWLRPDLPKKYSFRAINGKDKRAEYLLPPFGQNAFYLLQSRHDISKEIAEYLSEYNIDLVVDRYDNSIKIQRKIEGVIESLPFNLVADTLQRILFTLLAIKTNENSAIILEEPEAHTYPPFITSLAKEIVGSKTNQFFIATHSPYIITEMIETMPQDDLNVFVTFYKNDKTRVKKLSFDEIREISMYGVDIFLNIEHYYEDGL